MCCPFAPSHCAVLAPGLADHSGASQCPFGSSLSCLCNPSSICVASACMIQPTTKNTWGKNCICTKHIQTFLLSLLQKLQHTRTLFTQCLHCGGHYKQSEMISGMHRWAQEDVCRFHTNATALYIMNVGTQRSWSPRVSQSPSLMDIKGRLYCPELFLLLATKTPRQA